MSHIFISYSTKNSSYALRLAHTLREEGFDVWIDNSRLRSSDNWWEKIVKALGNCAAVIVVMTPEARQSRWVQREVTLADNWSKPTFPILLDGENWEIFVLTQFEDVRGGDLPRAEFYDDLSQVAFRQTRRGSDVTDTPLESNGNDSDIGQEIREEIANPPPSESLSAVSLEPESASDSRLKEAGTIIEATPPIIPSTISHIAATPTEATPKREIAGKIFDQTVEQSPSPSTVGSTFPSRRPLWKSGYTVIGMVIVVVVVFFLLRPLTTGLSSPTATPTLRPTPTATSTTFATSIQSSSIGTSTPTTGDMLVPGQIAYVSDIDGDDEIFLMNADGSNQTQLTFNDSNDNSPTWSPDGKQIAYSSYRNNGWGIYILNLDTNIETQLPYIPTSLPIRDYSGLDWSPGGEYIAFTSDINGHIYTISMSGLVSKITSNDVGAIGPAWSPDGSMIAYYSNQSGNFEIYIMDNRGNLLRQMTTLRKDATSPVWSPSGQSLAFASEGKIYTMNSLFERDRKLISDGQAYSPDWSPDGQWIVFGSQRDGNREIYLVDFFGTNTYRLTLNGVNDDEPVWRPTGN